MSIELVSKCYCKFIPNITIVTKESVIVCGFSCMHSIFAEAQIYLCCDNSEVGRGTFKWSICLMIQTSVNPFLIQEDVINLRLSIICVTVSVGI